ncbi:MAG TPA: SDR family NAD(P)-dependent oxidoreductase [Spirochaetia bacterium]|nr:SDR family NAD(P)-dependent oxidoreductase [Spirochaetia bacterium]
MSRTQTHSSARRPRCAMITGASQGLGRAFAEECAGRGMSLVLVALPGTGLPEVSAILDKAYRVPIEVVEADLTRPEAAAALAIQSRARGFDVDLLINNAGVGFTGRFTDSGAAQNEATVQLNVAAVVRLTQEMLPFLREQPRSWILNVASMGAFFPMPSMPVYSSTKAFVLTFTRLLRAELAQSATSVSALCPNGIRTNRATRDLIEKQGWAGRLTCRYPDEVARAGLTGLLGGRPLIVPGIANRLLAGAAPFVPAGLYMKVISRRWGTERPSRRVATLPGRIVEASS